MPFRGKTADLGIQWMAQGMESPGIYLASEPPGLYRYYLVTPPVTPGRVALEGVSTKITKGY